MFLFVSCSCCLCVFFLHTWRFSSFDMRLLRLMWSGRALLRASFVTFLFAAPRKLFCITRAFVARSVVSNLRWCSGSRGRTLSSSAVVAMLGLISPTCFPLSVRQNHHFCKGKQISWHGYCFVVVFCLAFSVINKTMILQYALIVNNN